MHPFQSQAGRMWDLMKVYLRAKKSRYWLETICLAYTILEIELRFLLSSKAGKSGKPISPQRIKKEEYLSGLAKLAKDNNFIDDNTWTKIDNLNKIRRDVIHGLAQGKISYDDLEKPCTGISELFSEIQEYWLPIKIGPEESYKDFKPKN